MKVPVILFGNAREGKQHQVIVNEVGGCNPWHRQTG